MCACAWFLKVRYGPFLGVGDSWRRQHDAGGALSLALSRVVSLYLTVMVIFSLMTGGLWGT